jgi:hypothetical protein
VAIYAQAAARFRIKKKEPAWARCRAAAARAIFPSQSATELHVSIYAQAAARFRIIKKKDPHGPGAAAPQHANFFDSQPRGVFVLFPISDIRYHGV